MKHHFQILQKILLSLESNEGAQEIKIYKRKKKKNQFLLSISFLEKILMIHFNNNINNNKHPLQTITQFMNIYTTRIKSHLGLKFDTRDRFIPSSLHLFPNCLRALYISPSNFDKRQIPQLNPKYRWIIMEIILAIPSKDVDVHRIWHNRDSRTVPRHVNARLRVIQHNINQLVGALIGP